MGTFTTTGLDVCVGIDDLFRAVSRSGEGGVTSSAGVEEVRAVMEALTTEDRGRVKGSSFFFGQPYYRGDPTTPAERLRQVGGLTFAQIDGPTLVRSALGAGDLDGLGIELHWLGVGGPVRLASVATDADRTFDSVRTIEADGRWQLLLRGDAGPAHRHAGAEARTTVVAGTVVTLLLAAVFVVLLSSRNRALRLVAAATGELRHQALHDALTGLPNRVLAMERAAQLLSGARRRGHLPAVLFLDVDDFKAINDNHGHAAGDQLLQAVAERLRSTVRGGETVGRLGGDEFVVLTEGVDGGDAEQLAARILQVMRRPFHLPALHGRSTDTSVSIGIATGDRATADELLRDADMALYLAKEAGKGRYAVFEAAGPSHAVHTTG